jgi:uncharacterized membrane protein YphA (DoxX/SURF4 family)
MASPAPTAAPRPVRPVIELLRIGLGLIWTVNVLYIAVPSNGYFSSFSATAASFAPSSLGGPGFANWVAQQPLLFSWVIAVTTAYLAFAFVTGTTTRLACFVGAAFNLALLLTQFSSLVDVGSTDVGPMPLYLLLYIGLFIGGAGQQLSVDAWLRRRRSVRAEPRPLVKRIRFPTSTADERGNA